MILKASQRGGSTQLAAHLLKTHDNEHVEVHELRGFSSEDLRSASTRFTPSAGGPAPSNSCFR
jgi:hypothetical protein